MVSMEKIERLDRHLGHVTRGIFSRTYDGPLFETFLTQDGKGRHISTFLPDAQLYLDVLLKDGKPMSAILHEGQAGEAVEVWTYVGFDAAAQIVCQLSQTAPDPERAVVWSLELRGKHWQSRLRFVFVDSIATPVLSFATPLGESRQRIRYLVGVGDDGGVPQFARIEGVDDGHQLRVESGLELVGFAEGLATADRSEYVRPLRHWGVPGG
ncbi:MAG: hypothetical protein AAFX50_00600 [Acidobacteriota bacterium]